MSDVAELYTVLGFISYERDQIKHVHKKMAQVAKKATWNLIKGALWPPFRRRHKDALQLAHLYATQAQCALNNYQHVFGRCAEGKDPFNEDRRDILVHLRIEAESNFDRALEAFELKEEATP